MSEFISVEPDGNVAIVRIDRPPANAMNLDLLEEGLAVCEELAADPPDAVVITGRPKFFSAGVDLKLVPTLTAEDQREMVIGINVLFAAWYGFERPVVCAVNGHAIAGGLILALCGDHRVGVSVAKYGLTELRAGVAYPAVAAVVVRAELGAGVVRRLALGAELIDGDAALELGALDEIEHPDNVEPRAIAVAKKLAEMPSGAYARVKQQVRGPALAEIDRVLAEGSDPLLERWLDEEAPEAVKVILGEA